MFIYLDQSFAIELREKPLSLKAIEKAIASINVLDVLYRLLLILFINAIIQKQIGIYCGAKNGKVYIITRISK